MQEHCAPCLPSPAVHQGGQGAGRVPAAHRGRGRAFLREAHPGHPAAQLGQPPAPQVSTTWGTCRGNTGSTGCWAAPIEQHMALAWQCWAQLLPLTGACVPVGMAPSPVMVQAGRGSLAPGSCSEQGCPQLMRFSLLGPLGLKYLELPWDFLMSKGFHCNLSLS